MGGRYDATSAVEADVRCVGWIDLDHTRVLGDTLVAIAREKGGIYRGGASGSNLALDQGGRSDVLKELRRCAAEAGGGMEVVPCAGPTPGGCTALGLPGAHQEMNARLALAAAGAALGPKKLGDAGAALAAARWPGRCQVLSLPFGRGGAAYVDGAHTEGSVGHCLEWFRQASAKTGRHQAMIFHCHHERDPVGMFRVVGASGVAFDEIYFCPPEDGRPSPVAAPTAREVLERNGMNEASSDGGGESSSWEGTLAVLWRATIGAELVQKPAVHIGGSVAECLSLASSRDYGEVDVLVTGSLYIVGSVIKACGFKEKDADGKLVVQ